MNRQFAETHEWVVISSDTAVIGISDFAQSELGDITYVELPSVGTIVAQGKEFSSIESVKAASDIYSPVAGEVIEVNTALEANPELVNSSPYGDGWLIKVRITAEPSSLMNEADYNSKYAH